MTANFDSDPAVAPETATTATTAAAGTPNDPASTVIHGPSVGERIESELSALARLWRYSRRGLVVFGGFVLMLGGIAMLVLPGPGLLVILAGLGLLAREFVWAERALHRAKSTVGSGVGAIRKTFSRRPTADAGASLPASSETERIT